MRWLGSLSLVVALVPAVGRALDAPHDSSFTDGNCDACHSLYNPTGSGQSDYSAACLSCHTNSLGSFGFPWLSSEQASAGNGGNHHSWSGYAENPAVGARTPPSGIASYLVDGRLQCITCHNPHLSSPELAPTSQHTSLPVGVATDETGGPATAAQMTLVTSGAVAKGYRLKIQSADGSGGTFVISHDFSALAPTWLNWNGTSWVVGTETGPGRGYANGTPVALDNPAVTVKWTAGAVAGSYWDFYVGYPFLRGSTQADDFCVHCHADRVMGHLRVRGTEAFYRVDGARKFSHPVGEGLNANGLDRDHTAPLRTSGAVPTGSETPSSNDLRLDGGVVRCTTCHAVHNADSNSLTEDAR